MALTPLPTPPTTNDPGNFDARADAWVLAQQTLVVEFNAALVEFNGDVEAALAAIDARVAAGGFVATSTTNMELGTGTKSFTIQPGRAIGAGTFILLASTASPSNYMIGQVQTYNANTGAVTASMDSVGGTGTFAAWTLTTTAKAVQPNRNSLTRSAWFNAG
jgi:hypothetical protein